MLNENKKKTERKSKVVDSESGVVIIEEINTDILEKKPPNFLQEFYQIKIHSPKNGEKIILSE